MCRDLTTPIHWEIGFELLLHAGFGTGNAKESIVATLYAHCRAQHMSVSFTNTPRTSISSAKAYGLYVWTSFRSSAQFYQQNIS